MPRQPEDTIPPEAQEGDIRLQDGSVYGPGSVSFAKVKGLQNFGATTVDQFVQDNADAFADLQGPRFYASFRRFQSMKENSKGLTHGTAPISLTAFSSGPRAQGTTLASLRVYLIACAPTAPISSKNTLALTDLALRCSPPRREARRRVS
jgi:hypothetical protein